MGGFSGKIFRAVVELTAPVGELELYGALLGFEEGDAFCEAH